MDVKHLGKQVLANGYQMVKSNKGILMYMGLMMVSSHCLPHWLLARICK